MNSQHNASNGSAMVMHNSSNHNNNRRSRTRSRSRSKSVNRRQGSSGGGGQSSLSAHIQQQMERPRRERDPTPLSRSTSAHNVSAPNLNYNNGLQQHSPAALSTPSRRSSAGGMPRRTNNNIANPSTNNNVVSSRGNHPLSSSEERAAIAASMAKNSFSAHRNLQKLIDEQRQLDYHRMEHAQHQHQQLQVYRPQEQQLHHHQEYRSPSSVAAVHQQQQHQQHHHPTPLKLMVGNQGFSRDNSISTMTPSESTPTSSPDVPQIQRVASAVATATPGRNSGYIQNPQRRRSASPRKQSRDQHHPTTTTTTTAFPPLPDFDEDQLTSENPDLELAQSIAKIMAFHKRSSTPGRRSTSSPSNVVQQQQQQSSNNRSLSQSREIVGYDANNAAQQQHHHHQQQQYRRSNSQLILYRRDSSQNINGKSRSFHSNSTAPTTTSSLDSGSLFATTSSEEPEPSNHDSPSFQTHPCSTHEPKSQQQQRRQSSTTPRYLDKETLYNHLQHAPRETRVQLTRHIENLQNENQRLNGVTSFQANHIEKLESEVGDLLKELLKYRREFGEMQSLVVANGSEGDVSSEHATAAPPPSSSAGGGMSSPSFSLIHSSSKVVGMNRQDSITNTDKEEELEVVRPYVKSKSLHEGTIDLQRRPATANNKSRLSNSITSAPIVSRTTSGGSNESFARNISMLKNLQLTSSCHSNGDDNDNQTRNSNTDSQRTGSSFHTAEESIFESTLTAQQRSFKEEKKADIQATSRWRRVSAIDSEHDDDPPSDCEGSIDEAQLLLMQQQQEHEDNQQDEDSHETRLKSNSLEDVFEPQTRRSCFVEQKGGSALSVSVPSMTDTVGSCSWSYSTPESGGRC